MNIFIVDADTGITKIEFGDIANLDQFYRDLDDSYEEWYDDIEDAEESLAQLEYNEYIKRVRA